MPFDQVEDNEYYKRWMSEPREQTPTANIETSLYDKWSALPTPPPMEPTRRERAKGLMEQATSAGRIPSTNIVKDLVKKYTDPEYIKRVDTAEHFQKTMSNLGKSAKELIPGLINLADKTLGSITRPGHTIMERGMEQAAAQKAKEMGMEPQAGQAAGTLEPLKNMADLALWAPKLIADVIKDPIGTVENRPLDIVLAATGGALHKGLRGAREPIPKGVSVPGEVKGLGIEFVNDKGQPISRTEAFRGKQARIEPSVEEPGKMKAVIAPPNPIEDHVRIVQQAIKDAFPVRRGQEALYHKEMQKRVGAVKATGEKIPGEAGFYAKLGELKGPLPKAEFESIRGKIPQENIDGLFNMIQSHPELSELDKVSAGEGLAKLFGEFGGAVPQPKQLAMLEKVFGPEFVKTASDKTPLFKRMKSLGIELANIPRAFMASADLSFGLRQGVVMAATHPAIFWKNFPKQVKYFAKERWLKESNSELASRPTFKLANESGVSLTNMGKEMVGREEPFQSQLAERIPILGQVVKMSNRAYSGLGNRLRMDTFDYLVNRAIDSGRDPFKDTKLAKDIATTVNTGTGRGSLGKWERAGPALNALFFSPKLMVSRLQMFNPIYYWKLDKFARVEALRQLASTAGAGLTILGLAKMAGAEVGTDIRSADFGKIKIGNTRFDIGGGFLQYLRLGGQLWTGEVVSSTTGKVSVLGEGYKPRTRFDIAMSALEYKTAPVVSFATSLLKGQESFGGEFKLTSEITRRLIPIIIQDLIDVYKDDPSLLPISALGIFGIGLQTYNPGSYKKRHGQRTSLR